jgi:hypothetical protein
MTLHPGNICLTFHSRTYSTLDEVTLEDEEENHDRDRIEHRSGNQQIVLRIVGAFEEVESQGQCVHIIAAQDNQGPEEVIIDSQKSWDV